MTVKITRLIITIFFLFIVVPVPSTFAFSSVFGEGVIFPGGSVFPDGKIFPSGSVFPNGMIFINGEPIQNPKQKIIVHNHKIFVYGYSSPNVKLKLLLHSKPMTVETPTDSNGYWSYEINNFPNGNHTLAMAVEDATGMKTKPVLAASFTVSPQNSINIFENISFLTKINYVSVTVWVLSTVMFLTFFYLITRLGYKNA